MAQRVFPDALAADSGVLGRLRHVPDPSVFFWPVGEAAFESLAQGVLDAYDALLLEVDGEAADILLSDVKFVILLIQHLHACGVEAACQRLNIALELGELSRPFYRPDWSALANVPERMSKGGTGPVWQTKRMAKNIALNRHASVWARAGTVLAGSAVWSLGSDSELKQAYAAQHAICADHYYAPMLLESVAGGGNPLPECIALAVERFLDAVAQLCCTILDTDFDRQAVSACWLARLAAIAQLQRRVLSQGQVPETLLVTNLASAPHKLIAQSMRRRGVHVVGFDHGNNAVNVFRPVVTYLEFSQCNEFVSATRRIAQFHDTECRLSPLGRRLDIRFTSAETSHYDVLLERLAGQPPVHDVRSIMVIGFSHNAQRAIQFRNCFFAYQLDLELRLIRDLKARGFRVIYKVHPEWARHVQAIFEAAADEVVAEPFEKTWARADALLFPFPQTTTFGFAVCTNRPIVALDLFGSAWNVEAMALLRRRCGFVPVTFEADGRIGYDADALAEIISTPPVEIDMSYVHEILCPDQ